MAQQIESKDLVQDKVLKPLRDDMDLTIKKSQELSDSLLRIVKSQADMANATSKSAKGYKELVQMEERSKVALSEKEKMDQRILNLQRQSTQITNLQRQRQAELNTEIQRRNKIARDEAKLTNQNFSAYEKLTMQIDKLTKEYRDLLVAEGKETAQTRKMRDEILKLNGIRNKANESLGMHQNKVGQYERALNGLNRTLGQLGLAFGVFQVLRDTFGIISASEDAFASLSAITGLTGEKFDVFKGAIMDTADELNVSGTVVAEAAEKIASAQPALLEDAEALASVTKEAITLNKAIKGDLTETSMALVGVMNQFSLGAEEASRVINVLAAGSQAGAATVNQINESMVKFGTTAKLMNISVEESVGAIETLGEKAIFGADAGTALRNILLKMGAIDVLPEKAQKQLEKYGVNTAIIKDETLSFEERLRELSKVAGDSTAIMQIFGTENATAATVLLNSLGTYEKMTDAVTGTNVAQEQAAINSDTLSAVIEELRAAWENLVIKWSEGTDVAGGLKAVLRFLADNLETIVNVVFNGVKAWILYKSTLTLVNKEGTGLIQVLRNLAKTGSTAGLSLKTIGKGMLGIVGVLGVLIPLAIDFGKAIYESFVQTTALDKVTEKYTARMIEERAEMDLLYFAIKTTTAGSKERQKVIDEINARYGTTLQNIQDETLFMNELWKAYQKVNAEMERRIMSELIQEELKNLFKARRELEKTSITTGFGTDVSEMALEEVNKQIAELQAELFNLNQEGGETGKTFTRMNVKQFGKDIEDSGKKTKKTSSDVAEFNEELGNMEDKMTSFLDFMEKENFNVGAIIFGEDGEVTKDELMADMKIFEEMAVKVRMSFWEVVSAIRESISETLNMISEMLQANSEMLDHQIAKQQQALDASINREQELRDIARERGLDATESIDAEREAQKRARREIEMLEQKKRNLEMMIAAMKLLSEGKSVSDIKDSLGQIKSFVEGSFYEGTPYTIADALGSTGTRDGHIVRIDDNESVFTGEQTRALGIGKGGNSTQDIVDMYKNGILSQSLRVGQPQVAMLPGIHSDRVLAKKLDALIDATNELPANMPRYDSVFNTQSGYMQWSVKVKNKTIKTRYNVR